MPGMSPSRPSVMGNRFSQIPVPRIRRSSFDLSHGHKTTFDAGFLIPVFCEEVLPGDTFSVQGNFFGRVPAMLFPILDNVFLDTFYFFVPNRILWDNWERFLGAQDTPSSPIDYNLPELDMQGMTRQFGLHSLGDYFGLPILLDIAEADQPTSLPFRAYNMIWNEWFRNQDVQGSLDVPKDDGPDDYTDFQLMQRGKRHDYLTSCLTSPQRGDAVLLPLGDDAPITGDIGEEGQTMSFTNDNYIGGLFANSVDPGLKLSNDLVNEPVGTAAGSASNFPTGAASYTVKYPDLNAGLIPHDLVADLANATAVTINQFREAVALQQILERDARGGTRYTEILLNRFGVSAPDFRLQRPEYLGGGSQRITMQQVAQTSASGGDAYLGQLAGYGTAMSRSGFVKSFVEHGWIIGLANVRADINYQNRIDRKWTRRTRHDVYDPLLAHLGEQAVLNREIFYDDEGSTADAVFGYQERWAEYRSRLSQITGLFRSDAPGTLENWHLALHFTAQPELDAQFMPDAPDLDRVIAIPDEPHILMDMFFKVRAARPMPVYSVPGLDRL